MIFRSQEFRERCNLCEQPATARCRQCQIYFCAEHGGARGCCSSCAATIDFALTSAGKGQRGLGAAVALISTWAVYVLSAYHMMNPAMWAVLLASGASGVGLFGWSFTAKARAERRLEKQLAEPRLLPAAPTSGEPSH